MSSFSAISEYAISEIPAAAAAVDELPMLLRMYGIFSQPQFGRGFAVLIALGLLSRFINNG